MLNDYRRQAITQIKICTTWWSLKLTTAYLHKPVQNCYTLRFYCVRWMMVTVTSQLEFVIDYDQVEVAEVVWSQQYSIPITGVLWPPP